MNRIGILSLIAFAIVVSTSSLVLTGCSENACQEGDREMGVNLTEDAFESKDAERDILSQLRDVIDLDPLLYKDQKEPIDYFRPSQGESGRTSSKIVEVEIVSSGIEGGKGSLDIHMIKENYYLDGTTGRRNDWATLFVEKHEGDWVIVEIEVQP